MPLYEFTCIDQDCENRYVQLELMVKLEDFDNDQYCEYCGEPLKRGMPHTLQRHGSWAEWRTDLAAGRKVR